MTPIEINKEIQDMVDEFTAGMEPIQKSVYGKIVSKIKELAIDASGAIKKTISNLKIAKQVQKIIDSVSNSPAYQNLVASVNSMIEKIVSIQKKYFSSLGASGESGFITEVQAQAFDSVVQQLTGAGIRINISSKAAEIVLKGVREGDNFSTISSQLKDFMSGTKEVPGKMVSYSSQITNDAIHGVSRVYNAKMVEDLGFEWFRYVGSLSGTSRPWCSAMVKKQWIHKSELPKLCTGNIDGKKVSLQGLIPDTNGENVVSRCGGYNCPHSMVPVPAEAVPNEIRERFE